VRRYAAVLNGKPLTLLSAGGAADGELTFHYAGDGNAVVTRRLTMAEGRIHEWLQVQSDKPALLTISTESGFDDIFDARGGRTQTRGALTRREKEGAQLTETYTWADGATQSRTAYAFSTPVLRDPQGTHYTIAAGQAQNIHTVYGPAPASAISPTQQTYDDARERARAEYAKLAAHGVAPSGNAELAQAQRDLSLLVTELDTGPYPYAGLPWFCTPFGRDGIMTALLTLEDCHALARGVLTLQAAHQADRTDKTAQAEPGKIFHEMRFGESSLSGENPFRAYYGGVDTTPLFVMLAGEHYRRTGDRAFAAQLYPHVVRALDWVIGNMEQHGGYVRYSYDPGGLTQQGWKDSSDSIFLADAPDALPADPIALCEVQAYAYAALQTGATFAMMQGDRARAHDYRARALDLRKRFNHDFWQKDMNCYAMALDGHDAPARVVSSNAGLALLTSIVPKDRARKLADRLMQPDSFSGFGIRTLAEGPGYKPVSYHRGSVWPHDTALVTLGFARHGLYDHARRAAAGLMAAARHEKQLPELFTGHARADENSAPVAYPSACRPQAWAAAALIGVAPYLPAADNNPAPQKPQPAP
jgi:glycogen debranching enzyme